MQLQEGKIRVNALCCGKREVVTARVTIASLSIACISMWLAHRDVNPMVQVRIPPWVKNDSLENCHCLENCHFMQVLSTITVRKSSQNLFFINCFVVINCRRDG